MITKEEIPDLQAQSVRVLLRNPLGHVVHDMTLPLVVTVDGVTKPYDVDKVVNEHMEFHAERHKVFMEAAAKRGHVSPQSVQAAQSPAEKDCGCGPK